MLGGATAIASTAASPYSRKSDSSSDCGYAAAFALSSVEWQRFREPIHASSMPAFSKSQAMSLRLTSRGVLLSNEVFQEFLAA